MSFAIDVNVLLYASDSASPSHAPALKLLDGCAARGELFYLGWPTIMNYIRTATSSSSISSTCATPSPEPREPDSKTRMSADASLSLCCLAMQLSRSPAGLVERPGSTPHDPSRGSRPPVSDGPHGIPVIEPHAHAAGIEREGTPRGRDVDPDLQRRSRITDVARYGEDGKQENDLRPRPPNVLDLDVNVGLIQIHAGQLSRMRFRGSRRGSRGIERKL